MAKRQEGSSLRPRRRSLMISGAGQEMLADGCHRLNMPVSQKVRVVYAEDAINESGKKPTSVLLIGKHDDAYRIGVVIRNFRDNDD